MTRFARAKGSKSSNERTAEEATSWNEFQRQIEDKRTDVTYTAVNVGKDTLKRIKEPKQCTDADWADFGLPQDKTECLQKLSKKRKLTDDNLTGKVSLKKKLLEKHEVEEKCNVSSARGEVEIMRKGKKKSENRGKGEEKAMEMLTNLGNDDQTFQADKLKYMKEAPVKNYKIEEHSCHDSNVSKKGSEYKRRKPYIGFSTININGVTINVSKFDGFDVKSEDAVRLKELRSNLLKEGIPRQEVEKTMKLERRKAEKALAREKKKVCFNCRKAGHLLSECPEIGSMGSKNMDLDAVNLCYKCGSTEHTHYQCQVKKKKEYSFATCFICKEQGHISSQCPDNPRGLYPQGGCCKVCGEVTHLKKDCPQLSKERSDNTVTLDTFASTSDLESLGHLYTVDVPKVEKRKKIKRRLRQ